MTLWGEPDQVHVQNMEQLHAYATEPQATEYHKKVHVYTGVMSQAWLYYISTLHKQMLQVVEMAWTDDSTIATFFYMCYKQTPSRCSQKRLESSDFNTGTVNQLRCMMDTKNAFHIISLERKMIWIFDVVSNHFSTGHTHFPTQSHAHMLYFC